MRRLARYRDMRLLLAGETLSLFGDRAMFLALGIWVKTLTGSSAAAGLVFFAFVVPTLAAPLGGVIVDRVARRRLLIAVDLAIGAVLLTLLFVHSQSQLWLIYLVTVLYGAAASLSGAARSALLTELLPGELLPDANAALQTIGQAMRLIAPLAGAGLFVAYGGGLVAALDAASFACSALCLLFVRARPAAGAAQRERHLRDELTAGMRHLVRTVPLRRIVLALAGAVLVFGFMETLIFALAQHGLHRPPGFVGVLLTAQGVGAVVGGVTAGRLLRLLGDAHDVGAGIALLALGCGLTIVPSAPSVLLGMAVAGLGQSWTLVGYVTAIQQRTPDQIQGRVYAAADTLVGTAQTVSIALGAGLSAVVDYRLLLALIVAVMAACGGYLLARGAVDAPAAVSTVET